MWGLMDFARKTTKLGHLVHFLVMVPGSGADLHPCRVQVSPRPTLIDQITRLKRPELELNSSEKYELPPLLVVLEQNVHLDLN